MGLQTLDYGSSQLRSVLPENINKFKFKSKQTLGNGIVLTVRASYTCQT